jgi:hypothetical protein
MDQPLRRSALPSYMAVLILPHVAAYIPEDTEASPKRWQRVRNEMERPQLGGSLGYSNLC